MADQLVVARVIDRDIGLGDLPNRTVDSCVAWFIDFANETEFISLGMWQAQLDGDRL